MKVKDYGCSNSSSKEKLEGPISPQEIEAQLELMTQDLMNSPYLSKNSIESSKDQKINNIKEKIKQPNEKYNIKENKIIKYNLNKNQDINNNNIEKNGCNQLNVKNCINNIDFDKNIIIINKQNLKEFNNINKEIKKGEIININNSEKFNISNKEAINSIKKNYEYLIDDFFNSSDNFEKINLDYEFPNEVIEKFLEKKRNKNKEKNNNNYITSFGRNPLEKIKEVQNGLIAPSPPSKNSKTTIKQFKLNQKNLKEQNILLQKYIKSFPILNCPESKIFKLNQYYYFNKISDDKNINNNLNNDFNKNSKFNSFYNDKIKLKEDENNNINKEKEESEEETINRHIKKKIINKKRKQK